MLCHLSHSASPFFCVLGIFEIGCHELFAQADFEIWSFCSLSPEELGL
jgi:hypothetical protein